MLNVLLIFSHKDIGGAERSLTKMAIANDNNKVNYQLATFSAKGKWSNWLDTLNINYAIFNNNLLKVIKYIKKEQIDAIYIVGFRLSVYLRLLKFLYPKTKLVQGIRWNPDSQSKLDKYFRVFEKKNSSLLDGYITNSSIAKKTLLKLGIKTNIKVIYNGLSGINTSIKSKTNNQVICIANLSNRKGHIEFLKVIKLVIKKITNTKFIFIGRDELNGEFQKAINSNNLDKNVIYLGFQEDISKFLSSSDLFVLPSLYGEGCPTSILEAFSYKLPIIAHNIDGIPELVKNNIEGLLYDVGDNKNMANGIIDLLTNSKKAVQMGEAGFYKLQHKFSLQNMLSQHNNFFLNL